jgi:hypothetical protein
MNGQEFFPGKPDRSMQSCVDFGVSANGSIFENEELGYFNGTRFLMFGRDITPFDNDHS